MIENAKLHHIGYAVTDIRLTASLFAHHGYQAGNILYEDALNVELCYLHKPDSIAIELVHQYQPDSLESKLIQESGVMPYHICYEVSNFETACLEMQNLGYTPLFSPTPVRVLSNKLICYFHHPDMGYIELLEAELHNYKNKSF